MRLAACLLALLAVAPVALGGVAPAAAAPACAEVPGLDALLTPGRVLLLGEMHGSEQSPAFLATVACQALARGLGVTVGLEIPRAEQERVDPFLRSSGDAAAISRLLAGDFWRRPYQDGRSSRAMLGLLAELRRRRADGGDLAVLLIDRPEPGAERNLAMAERLAGAIAGAPDRFLVVLTGNLHNRLTVGWEADPKLEPMGWLLARRLPAASIVSLDVAYTGGEAWLCFSADAAGCKPQPVHGKPGPASGVELFPTGRAGPYSGRYFVGALSASPPAVSPPAVSQ